MFILGRFLDRQLRCRLEEEGLSLLGGLRKKTIPYWQIESAKLISWMDWLLDGSLSGFGVRRWGRTFARRFVLVRQRDGKVYILTPEDPEGFVRTVDNRIAGTAPPKVQG